MPIAANTPAAIGGSSRDDVAADDRLRRRGMDGDAGIGLMAPRGRRQHAVAEGEGGGADEDELSAQALRQRRIAKQIGRADRRDRARPRAERGRDRASDRNRRAGDERRGFDRERGQRAVAALFRRRQPPQDAVVIELEVAVRGGDGLRQRRARQQPAAVFIDDGDGEHRQTLRAPSRAVRRRCAVRRGGCRGRRRARRRPRRDRRSWRAVARSHGHAPTSRSDCSSMATTTVCCAACCGRRRRTRSRAGSSSGSTTSNASSSVTATPAAIAIITAVRVRSIGLW